MSEDARSMMLDLEVDKTSLYREDVVSDLHAATIRRMIPIKIDGSDDPDRAVEYVGQATILSQAGPLPVQARIEASSLEEAVNKFPEAIQEAVEKLIEEAKQYQREQATRIITPGSPGGGGLGGGGLGGPGGMVPPGGKIHLG